MSVIGGYYKGSGADITADVTGHGIDVRGHTTYVSLAQGAVAFPRTPWIDWFSKLGGLVNYVLELKCYGATPPSIVPQPNGLMTFQGATKFYSWIQLLDGDLDPLLDQVAAAVAALPYRVHIQVCSERDTDHQQGGTVAGAAYTWAQLDELSVAGVRYVLAFMRARGVGNATFSAGIGGWDHDSFVRSYVDGVDVVQFNAYNHGTWREPADTFGRTYAWLADLPAASQALPVSLAEYGCQPSTGGHSQSAWLRSVPAALAGLPRVAYAGYFNSGWGAITDSDGLAALAETYATAPFVGGDPS